LGGDHSITFDVLKGLKSTQEEISIVYLDAHPDIVCSERRYYGSVICDVNDLTTINLKKSAIIGVRATENEEVTNLTTYGIPIFTPLDIQEMNLPTLIQHLDSVLLPKMYLSIDMDVFDPAFSPGVSTPEPGGLTSVEVLYLCTHLSQRGLLGFDVTQVSPPQDIHNRTSHLAGKLILEILASLR
jgi:agmatinase